MVFPAHIRIAPTGENCIQSVSAHCRNCAQYAAELSSDGLVHTAYLAGLLHDMGKYTRLFKDYIERAASGDDVRRGSVNHSFAGVRFVWAHWHTDPTPTLRNITAELIAAAIGGHHGVFDCIGPDGSDGFLHRLTKEGICYEEARDNFLRDCAGLDELDKLFDQAQEEIATIAEAVGDLAQNNDHEARFYLACLTRMILSAVIDADRRDTAEFMGGEAFTLPKQHDALNWAPLLDRVERKLNAMPNTTDVQRARSAISAQCRLAAERERGVYRLSVPTGGGKTLAGLRYALATAAQHKNRRIFFVIPLLSVLEQNAAVLRKYIGEDGIILEHHSNLVQEQSDADELDERELLLETWSSGIVITTLVQLLNTLFLGKSSCIRRMNALADSVIVIDEVQSVPKKMLSLFNLALNFLARVCGATIVLCSATEPNLDTSHRPLQLSAEPDLVPYDPRLWEVFRRVDIVDWRRPEGYTTEELADFAWACAEREGSLLLVCNTKAEAAAVYTAVKQLTGMPIFHLSTAMCMAHRTETLEHINRHLKGNEPVICIATQLVEAGVDFSFACVIRVSAGLDNVIQAAGRCNRGGEKGRICPVYIVNIRGENLSHLPDIKNAQVAAESVLTNFEKNPNLYGGDLTSDASISAYYRYLYNDMPQGAQDYPVPELNTSIFRMLADNQPFWCKSANAPDYALYQAFKTAGREFCVFENNTVDVLVPFGGGQVIIAQLHDERGKWDLVRNKALVEQAKPFTISLYAYQLEQLKACGGVIELWDGAIWELLPNYYAAETGLNLDGDSFGLMEG